METINGRLLEEGDRRYKVNHQRPFQKMGELSSEDMNECFEFAYEMAFGEGNHRSNRSGGKRKRKPGEIFIDTFQGKAAEYAIFRYLLENDIETTKPDISVEGYGVWDSFDLEYADIHIAVKSTKFYGNLLLLETKDWNERGEYVPNNETGINKYDMLILIRVSPDAEKAMEKRGLLYKSNIEKILLQDIIYKLKWTYDIAGYITNKDLVRLIERKYILPKGAMLNGKTPMDAENYYVQAGDMRSSKEMIHRLQKYKQTFEKGLTEECGYDNI